MSAKLQRMLMLCDNSPELQCLQMKSSCNIASLETIGDYITDVTHDLSVLVFSIQCWHNKQKQVYLAIDGSRSAEVTVVKQGLLWY